MGDCLSSTVSSPPRSPGSSAPSRRTRKATYAAASITQASASACARWAIACRARIVRRCPALVRARRHGRERRCSRPGRSREPRRQPAPSGPLPVEHGQFAAARPWFERAVTAKGARRRSRPGRSRKPRLNLHRMGSCLSSTGQFAAAQPWFERAVTAAEQGDVHGRVDHKNLAQTFVAARDAFECWG